MRKILKALSLVMVLVMCFTMVFTTAVSAEGTDTLVLSVDNAAPKAGETVNITVTSNFTTVAGAHFAIDLAGLEYVSVAGDYAEYFSAETMNFVKEFNEDNGNLVESGVLFVITATVPADAEAGTVYNVGFGTIATNKEFCDYDLNEVVVTKTGVDVIVAADEPEHTHTWTPIYDGDIVAATGTSSGQTAAGSMPVECECGATDTQVINYYHYYGFATYGVNYESEIQFQVDTRKAHIERQGAYDEAFVVIKKEYATGDAPKVIIESITADTPTTDVDGKECYSYILGIPAKELTDRITGNVYVKYNGQWYNGITTSKTVEEYALPLLADSSVKETEKKLIANMLTYGSKMQSFKGYNTENLADANLGEYSSYVTTTNPVMSTENRKNPYDTTKSEVIFNAFTLDMASKVGIIVDFRTDFYTDGSLDDLNVVVSYETSEGTNSTTYTADGENAYAPIVNKNQRYSFNYDIVPAKFMRAKITIEAYNGDQLVSYICTNSIEAQANYMIEGGYVNADETALYYAMINFGDAAANHFVV